MAQDELYDYQREDVEHLAKQKNALIGSEMGTGKTLEALKLDQAWFQQWADENPNSKVIYRTLVIAPINTFAGWIKQIKKNSPDAVLKVIDRKDRSKFLEDIKRGRGDIFLMHWDALRLMPELNKIQFGCVIADECHRASNRKAMGTRYLKKIPTWHKLGLSGTASGDKPDALWSILNWLWPTYYSSYWRFRKHYCIEEDTQAGQASYRKITGVNLNTITSLHKEMAPWYKRHLKREKCCAHHPNGVMHWLPEKTYETVWVDLSPAQRRVYEQMRKNMVAWVGEHEETPLTASIVVAQMTRLTQMALATPEVDSEGKVTLHMPSSKMDALKEILNDNPDKAFVVFTSSKQMANICQAELSKSHISSMVLSGDTPEAERRSLVDDFNGGRYRVVVGVIAAIAEGIDGLQRRADTGIFLDRSWSTLKNKQAEDRLHRGGQENAVTIIDVMARNTVDFGRKTKVDQKWEWIKTILGDNVQKDLLEEDYYA